MRGLLQHALPASSVALVAFAIRLLVVASAPAVLQLQTGDYALYDIGARHILQHGDFSNSLFLVRPPLYPLVLAASTPC